MKLSQLFSIYPSYKFGSDPRASVSGLVSDSRQIKKDCVFIAIKGERFDGHSVLDQVVEKGASALVVESEARVPKTFSGAVVVVDDSRKALGQLSAHYYGYPSRSMYCMGVTGTNGKTSVTYMLEAILSHAGMSCAVMGTIDHHLGDKVFSSELTTEDSLTLQRRLLEFSTLGAKALALEVSSHALDQGRVDNVEFNSVVFTNLTRDHLDYHRSEETYFKAKERLFRELPWKSEAKAVRAIINADDPWSKKLNIAERASVWTYGSKKTNKKLDFSFELKSSHFSGTEFSLECPAGSADFFLPVIGLHNIYNAVAAVAAALDAGVSLEACLEALYKFKSVPGRLERVSDPKGRYIFVDYAHTDNALGSVLGALIQVRKLSGEKNKVITVFGCGGDRDRGKRPLMGFVASNFSDIVIVTSDNPRKEEPMVVIEEILKGRRQEHRSELFVEPDRRVAIGKALEVSKKGDVILIAGKGHEPYQIIGEEKFPFDDRAVVEEFLNVM